MRRLILGALTALAGAAILTTSGVSGQGRVDSPGVMTPEGGVPALGSYKVPKTPWGEPDLQGTYNANDLQGVPMQRAQTVGTRYRLNDEEFKQRVAQRDQNVANDNSDEFSLERAEEFEARFGTVGGAVSPPPHWLERARSVSRVSSYVIDPPDGRIPALTPAAQAAAQQRQQAQAARRRQLNGIEAEWTTDRSNYDRCISTGVLNSITPKIYNSGSRIVQGPGWLAFQNEMIHETRVIPTDGRKQVGAAVKNWMGTSVGRWEGDVLVVETRNIKPESPINGQPLSDEGVLIERFTLADAQHARLPHDGQRPEGLHRAVDAAAADPARRELRLLRIRVPRGQLRDAQPPRRLARRGEAARRGGGSRREDSRVRRAGARRRCRARRRRLVAAAVAVRN